LFCVCFVLYSVCFGLICLVWFVCFGLICFVWFVCFGLVWFRVLEGRVGQKGGERERARERRARESEAALAAVGRASASAVCSSSRAKEGRHPVLLTSKCSAPKSVDMHSVLPGAMTTLAAEAGRAAIISPIIIRRRDTVVVALAPARPAMAAAAAAAAVGEQGEGRACLALELGAEAVWRGQKARAQKEERGSATACFGRRRVETGRALFVVCCLLFVVCFGVVVDV
jgi:hypothetical protein